MRSRWRVTGMVLLAGFGATVVLGGCGSETTVEDESTSQAASAAASGGQQSAPAGGASPGQTNPSLPPPSPEPDNDAVDAALQGMSQADAESTAIAAGYTIRIASVDGEGRAMTMDYRYDRINLELEGGLVTRAYVG